MISSKFRVIVAVSTYVASQGAAIAQDVAGVWLRDNGRSQVRIYSCGDVLCGSIAWLKDPSGPGRIGQRVFFDMTPQGDGKWKGKAFNPEDSKTYTGMMSLSGNSLTTGRLRVRRAYLQIREMVACSLNDVRKPRSLAGERGDRKPIGDTHAICQRVWVR